MSYKFYPELNEEQEMRRSALFQILISIFERAYLLLYKKYMSQQRKQLWFSWEYFIRQWCRRADFNQALPELLVGEDSSFAEYIQRIAKEESNNTIVNHKEIKAN